MFLFKNSDWPSSVQITTENNCLLNVRLQLPYASCGTISTRISTDITFTKNTLHVHLTYGKIVYCFIIKM